jgi:hypothetical protein
LRGAEEQGHRGLRHHRGESAGEGEDEVGQRPEGALDVLSEDRQEHHVAQDVISAAVLESRPQTGPAEAQRQPSTRMKDQG